MVKAADMVNIRFGRLLVVSRGPDKTTGKKPVRQWHCRCDCGTDTLTCGADLRSGHAKSCGCLHREGLAVRSRTHGLSTSPEYTIWHNMRGRCSDPSAESFKRYGGRGIKVCARWAEFAAFYADMGPRPEGMTLERINNDGNYEPSNCCWATRLEQAQNTRKTICITFDGETMTLTDWVRRLKTHRRTLLSRWQKHRTLSPPIGRASAARDPHSEAKKAA